MNMASLFLPALVLLLCVSFAQVGAQTLTVNVSDDGSYTILRKGTVWLRSAPAFFVIDNTTYSEADSTLTLVAVNSTTAAGYLVHNLYYHANSSDNGGTDILASINVYNAPMLGFNVTFPTGANGTQAASVDSVICGFPGFQIDPEPAKLAYLSFGTSTFEAATGRWQNSSTSPALLYGGRQGSGPLVLFDRDSNALAMGPSSHFTTASLWQDVERACVYWGIMGGVTQLPVGFMYSVALVDSEGSVGNAVLNWGLILNSHILSAQGKRVQARAHATIPIANLLGTLGYWTGPGSAYYSGPQSGKNYEETLVDVREDSDVDYLHVEVDDWWYEKGQGGGVKTWTSNASVFPDGLGGMANKTNWQVAAACGVWAVDNTYSKVNGGAYNFLLGDACALPDDQTFWDFLFKSADARIGVFVQKAMEQQYLCMTSEARDVDVLQSWMTQLAASSSNPQFSREVLFSGALPRMAMEAAFGHDGWSPAVEVGSTNTKDANHWKVGVANIFIDALGLRPFFGAFRTYSNDSAPATQLSPHLYSLMSTLTGGPVAIGDELGKSDKLLLERCCTNAGVVLPPSHPAKAIDEQLQHAAWGGEVGATGAVWSAWTANRINSAADLNLFHGVILATAMTRPFNVTPSNTALAFKEYAQGVRRPTKLFRWENPYILHDFTDDNPYTLSNCTTEDYCLLYAAPVINFKGKDVVIMGELTKWVPMSSQRVVRVEVGETIKVYVRGVPLERVLFYFHVDEKLQTLEHRIALDGSGLIEYELGPIPAGSASVLSGTTSAVNYVIALCVGFLMYCGR